LMGWLGLHVACCVAGSGRFFARGMVWEPSGPLYALPRAVASYGAACTFNTTSDTHVTYAG